MSGAFHRQGFIPEPVCPSWSLPSVSCSWLRLLYPCIRFHLRSPPPPDGPASNCHEGEAAWYTAQPSPDSGPNLAASSPWGKLVCPTPSRNRYRPWLSSTSPRGEFGGKPNTVGLLIARRQARGSLDPRAGLGQHPCWPSVPFSQPHSVRLDSHECPSRGCHEYVQETFTQQQAPWMSLLHLGSL